MQFEFPHNQIQKTSLLLEKLQKVARCEKSEEGKRGEIFPFQDVAQ